MVGTPHSSRTFANKHGSFRSAPGVGKFAYRQESISGSDAPTPKSSYTRPTRTGTQSVAESGVSYISLEASKEVKKHLKEGLPQRHFLLRFALSLRLLLSFFCVVVIMASSIFAWYFTYSSGLTTIDSLTQEFQQEMLPLVTDSIRDRLERAEKIVRINKLNFKKGLFTNSPDTFQSHFFTQLNGSGFTSSVHFTSPAGGLYGSVCQPDGLYCSKWMYDEKTKNQSEWFVNDEGEIESLNWATIYDNTGEVWYLAVNQSQPTGFWWTKLYVWFGRLWLTHVTGAYNSSGLYLGVTGVDLQLGFLNQILQKLNLRDGYSLYVVDTRSSSVVASFPSMDLLRCVGGTGSACDGGTLEQIPSADMTDPSIKYFFSYVEKRYGSWANVKDELVESDVHDGIAHYVLFGSVSISNIKWCVILAIDKEVIYGPIKSRATVVLGIVFGIVGAAALLAILFSLMVSRPLAILCERMWQIATMASTLFEESGEMATHQVPVVSELREMHLTFFAMKRAIMAFSKYVPMSVVLQLLAQNSSVSLGMEPTVVTIMFMDIADFTKLCERIKPGIMIQIMTGYFQSSCEAIHFSGGTVDKFIGDAIMAFWNAPNAVPNHQRVACEAVLQILEQLVSLNVEWREKKWPEIRVRVGLHCGKVLVGNVGSEARMNYTCMGDGVNLASRLEALGKVYGVCAIVSEAIHAEAKEDFLFNSLDTVVVKGKSADTQIYELVCYREVATPQQLQMQTCYALCNQYMKQRKFQQLVAYIDGHDGVKPPTVVANSVASLNGVGITQVSDIEDPEQPQDEEQPPVSLISPTAAMSRHQMSPKSIMLLRTHPAFLLLKQRALMNIEHGTNEIVNILHAK